MGVDKHISSSFSLTKSTLFQSSHSKYGNTGVAVLFTHITVCWWGRGAVEHMHVLKTLPTEALSEHVMSSFY